MNYKSEEIKKSILKIFITHLGIYSNYTLKRNRYNQLTFNHYFDNRINHIYFTNNNELDNIYNYLKNNNLLSILEY